jgi:DNA adenine methylase
MSPYVLPMSSYTTYTQNRMFDDTPIVIGSPPQLLKWVGNKHRFAEKIVSMFPVDYNKYIEPFVGTGAVLATLSPPEAIAGDMLKPLIELMIILQSAPEKLVESYKLNWELFTNDRKAHYERIKGNYNKNPNPFDLLFISRTCYGGVMRFTKEGKISTPIGPHKPIPPTAFEERVIIWNSRVKNTKFMHADYRETMSLVEEGDIIYCDPPYVDSQAILYGAQAFQLKDLLTAIQLCVKKGAKVALSIDGTKKSGSKMLNFDFPDGLFNRELFIDNGHSMLRRFQKTGETMDGEFVKERLLLTW